MPDTTHCPKWDNINKYQGKFKLQIAYLESSLWGQKTATTDSEFTAMIMKSLRVLLDKENFHSALKPIFGDDFPLSERYLLTNERDALLRNLYKNLFSDWEAKWNAASSDAKRENDIATALYGTLMLNKNILDYMRLVYGQIYLEAVAEILQDKVEGLYEKQLDKLKVRQNVLEHTYKLLFGAEQWKAKWQRAEKLSGQLRMRAEFLARACDAPNLALSTKELIAYCLASSKLQSYQQEITGLIHEEIAPEILLLKSEQDIGKIYITPVILVRVKDKEKLKRQIPKVLDLFFDEEKVLELGYVPLQIAPTRLISDDESKLEKKWRRLFGIAPREITIGDSDTIFDSLLFPRYVNSKPQLDDTFYIEYDKEYWLYKDSDYFYITATTDLSPVYCFRDYWIPTQLFPKDKIRFGKPNDIAQRIVFHIPGNIRRVIDSEVNTICYPNTPIFSQLIICFNHYDYPFKFTGNPPESRFLLLKLPSSAAKMQSLKNFCQLDYINITPKALTPEEFRRLQSLSMQATTPAYRNEKWVFEARSPFSNDWDKANQHNAPQPIIFKASTPAIQYLGKSLPPLR